VRQFSIGLYKLSVQVS